MLEPSYVVWVLRQVARHVERADVGEHMADSA